jgi:hypothetical protein
MEVIVLLPAGTTNNSACAGVSQYLQQQHRLEFRLMGG